MTKGIDCATPVTAKAAEILAAEGFGFVGRYLVPPSYAKALTREEAEAICDAGLQILSVWETTTARMRGGAAAGREDGARAAARARELKIPFNAVIYFAADFDAMQEDLLSIRDYMEAVKQEILPYYRAGVYGNYRVIEELRGTVSGLWQCVAWSGGRVSDAVTVYQAQWQGTAECRALAQKVGFAVDIDECPNMARAGMWSYRAEPEEEEGMERYNTVAELPKWAEPTIRKLISKSYLKGNGGERDAEGLPADLDLSHDMVRILVVLDRAGMFA